MTNYCTFLGGDVSNHPKANMETTSYPNRSKPSKFSQNLDPSSCTQRKNLHFLAPKSRSSSNFRTEHWKMLIGNSGNSSNLCPMRFHSSLMFRKQFRQMFPNQFQDSTISSSSFLLFQKYAATRTRLTMDLRLAMNGELPRQAFPLRDRL